MRETLFKFENFENSSLEETPSNWRIQTIGQLADTYAGGTPSRTAIGLFGGLIPWVKSAELNQGEINDTQEKLTELGYLSSSAKWVPANTPLVAMYGATAGVVSWLKIRAVTNQAVLAVLPRNEQTDARWLYWILHFYSNKLIASVQGSGQPNLNKNLIDELRVLQPCLTQQRRIAEILDTVDEAIARTSSLIAKLKQMKAGLLHDLLTRGLDENGELRDAIAHPEQFKNSPLGQIPIGWDIYKTGTIASIKYGINEAVDQTLESGVLTITLPCVSQTGELLLNQEVLALSARHKVRNEDILQLGDLLFNWRNGSQEHLGKTAYFDTLGEYTHVGFLLRIRTNPELCNSRYLWWRISYMKSQGFFLRAKSQVNNTFNSEELANMCVIVPSLAEQLRIVDALEPCEQRIRTEEAYLNKLKLQKQGLMHDLLTGRIRVEVQEN